MRLVRLLSSIVALTLVFQLCGIAAPMAFSAAGVVGLDTCTCPAGGHATCPMHHGKNSTDPSGCAMRSASLPLDLALLTLGSGVAVPSSIASFAVVDHSSALVTASVSSVPTRTDSPVSPPPRS